MIPKKHLILIFYKAMFAGKDVYYKGVKFPLKLTKGLKRYDIHNLLFIEQNSKAKSEYFWASNWEERFQNFMESEFNLKS